MKMKNLIKNRKAELTTQQIVMLIILITSFAVILFFIFRLNLGETTDKQVCHNSVVMKSQSKLPTGGLDCKTNYVCISGGGKCEGINPSETINLEMENPKEEIMDAILQEMADCWWMFGEGKVDYVGGINFKNNKACSICSIVAFDEKLKESEELSEIKYSDFYNYLKKEKNGETYLYYLYNTNDLSNFDSSYLENSFEFDKQYFVLTGLGKEGAFSTSFNSLKQVIIFNFVVSFFDEDEKEKKLENLPVVVLEKTTKNYEKIGCDEYLTKA